MEATVACREIIKHPLISIPAVGILGAGAGAACGAAVGAIIGAPVALAAAVGAVAFGAFGICNRSINLLAEKLNLSQRTVALLNIAAMVIIGSAALTGAVALGILVPGSTAAMALGIGLGLGIAMYAGYQRFQMQKAASSSYGQIMDF